VSIHMASPVFWTGLALSLNSQMMYIGTGLALCQYTEFDYTQG